MKVTASALMSPIADIVGSKGPALRPEMPGCQAAIRPLPSVVIDVITIGDESTVFKPVERALAGSGWLVRHADTVHSAGILVATNEQCGSSCGGRG